MTLITFNGNANDETGNGYDGMVYGATLTGDRSGNLHSAYSFDGVDDYIDVGTEPDVPTWENYTISVWFLNDGRGDKTPGFGQKIIDKSWWYLDFNLSLTWNYGWVQFHTFEGPWGDPNSSGNILDDSKDFRDNMWHHLVVNKEGSLGEMWVDGILKGTSDNIRTVPNDMKLVIGSSEWTHSHQQKFWSGKIDDIRIYNRVLSGDEIRQLYGVYSCVGFAPPFDVTLELKQNVKRAIPLKVHLYVGDILITESNIAAPPVVNVYFTPWVGRNGQNLTDELVLLGAANDGNEFRFDVNSEYWIYNLGTKQFFAAGTYTIEVVSGDPSYTIDPTCSQQFVRLE